MSEGKKKPIFKKWWFWVIVIVILVAAGAGSQKPSVVESNGETSSSQSSAPKKEDTASEEEPSTENLAAGTAVDLGNGVTVTVNSIQTGLVNYDGSTMVGVNVTYANNSDESVDYNAYDWKGEDSGGAQEASEYYSDGNDELTYGTLAKGGTKSGNLYFKDGTVKIVFMGNFFSKDVKASWTVQ